MKTTLTALLSLALVPAAASAYAVGAPLSGTVTATTYYPNGTFHGAVDIASNTACGYWGLETGVNASLFWNVTVRTTERACVSNNQNEAKHTFANGYVFRLRGFLYVAGLSKDKTCNRCQIGDENSATDNTGHFNHLQYDKSGTLNTAWYTGTTRGEFLDRDELIGNIG